MNRGQYDKLVHFYERAEAQDSYGQPIAGGDPVLLAEGWARVRYGPSGERREAAQEGASQAATFELMPTDDLLAVPMTAFIDFDGSEWNILGKDDLERNNMRFTAVRAR